jgi:hypothetical protein
MTVVKASSRRTTGLGLPARHISAPQRHRQVYGPGACGSDVEQGRHHSWRIVRLGPITSASCSGSPGWEPATCAVTAGLITRAR